MNILSQFFKPVQKQHLAPQTNFTLVCSVQQSTFDFVLLSLTPFILQSDAEQLFTLDSNLLFSTTLSKDTTSALILHTRTNEKLKVCNKQCKQGLKQIVEHLQRVFPQRGFNEVFKPLRKLGKGSFATVYLVEERESGRKYAAKMFSKEGQKLQLRGKQAMENEMQTLKELQHPNIVAFHAIFQTENLIYLITQHLSEGTLQEHLRKKGRLQGEVIVKMLCDILSALQYLSSKKVMHRDIKPENIMVREDGSWVLCDLGLVAHSDREYLYDRCGTTGYMAPELSQTKYDERCDMYSLGIVAYQLFLDCLPFQFQSTGLFDKKIRWMLFEREECLQLPPIALAFLQGLLESDPAKRSTPTLALQHPFFQDTAPFHSYRQHRINQRQMKILTLAQLN